MIGLNALIGHVRVENLVDTDRSRSVVVQKYHTHEHYFLLTALFVSEPIFLGLEMCSEMYACPILRLSGLPWSVAL